MFEALDALVPVVQFGVVAGVFAAVLFGAIKLGWKFAPWIAGAAFLIYLFG